MLVLKRKEGQWIEVTHAASGDTLRIRVYDICGDFPGRANLAFDDPTRLFEIQRPERVRRAAEAPAPEAPVEA
jgi:hypothetical protein